MDEERPRGWTYTLDGHDFYVLDLGTEGVFAYDLATGQWSQFETLNYSGTWNMKRGIMWKNRVLAGDIEFQQVRELDPGATIDQETLNIDHVVTGMVPARTRQGRRQDSLRVMAAATSSTATIRFRYSDDFGNTWSAYSTLVVSKDGCGQSFDWLSLGAIQAPGRIFEICDSSSITRIDGADFGVDGSDDG